MIFAYSILRGYTALRGTMVIHLPMLISMIVFIRPPPTTCEITREECNENGVCQNVFIQEPCFERAEYWYYLAIGLHTLLAILHILLIVENAWDWLPQAADIYFESGRIFAIPLQVLNFIFQCTMFLTNPDLKDQNLAQQTFDFWIFVEALTMISIVFSNIIFVLVRNCRAELLPLKFRSLSSTDTKQDYISTMETQFMVNIFSQATNNVVVYAFIINSQYWESEHILDGERRVLNVQFGMQVVQLICVVALMFTPLRSSKKCMCWYKGGPAIHWLLAQLSFLIIPICSLIYWIAEFKTVT